MKTEDLTRRRKAQFRFKLWSGLLPLFFIGPVAYGVVSLFYQFIGIETDSAAWSLFLAMIVLLLLMFYAIGFFSGSLRTDGNIISILSRMDSVEQKALSAVLEEITAQEEKDRKNGGK